MRIIAGDMKGRALHVPRRATFRPTTDRVKEALFNMLNGMLAWGSCRVCDLFAGSGNLGLEALSRGARSATFVEESPQQRAVLQRNIKSLGVADRTQVLPLRAEHFQFAEAFKVSDIESIYPSHVIPSQYAAKTLLLADGRVISGIVGPGPSGEKLVLTSEGDKIAIAEEDIDEISPSQLSGMPEGLLKELTQEDIADLFAYLSGDAVVSLAERPDSDEEDAEKSIR